MANALASKFLSRIFKKVGDVVWDLSSGQQGIKDANGVYVLSKEEVPATENSEAQTTYQVSVNPFVELAAQIPAFAIATTIDKVNVGDIVVGDSKILGFVVGKTDKSLTLLDKGSMQKTYTPPKVAIMGTSGALVVKNLFSLVGGNGNLASLQGNLLPLLVLGGDSLDFDKIMPLILMQSMSGANGQAQANPMASMLPFLLLGKSGSGLGNIDPMMLMAMSGGFGGGAAMNPMMLMALSGGLGDDAEKVQSLPALTPAPAIPPLVRR